MVSPLEGCLIIHYCYGDMTNTSSTISVITVCYNSGKTLEGALATVARQSLKKVEHIIIDGGSTDTTLSIIEKYRSKLSIVVSEPDRGIYDAMNKGLSRATGDIVCFLNADDLYAHDDVLRQVTEKMDSVRLDALLGDVAFFKDDNPSLTVRRYRSQSFRPDRIAYGWMPAHPAMFVRRAVFQRVGFFRDDYRIAGDFEFIARAFSKENLRYDYLPEILVRMRAGGISTAGWSSKLLLNREVLRACRENGIQTNMFKILSKYPVKLLEMWRR